MDQHKTQKKKGKSSGHVGHRLTTLCIIAKPLPAPRWQIIHWTIRLLIYGKQGTTWRPMHAEESWRRTLTAWVGAAWLKLSSSRTRSRGDDRRIGEKKKGPRLIHKSRIWGDEQNNSHISRRDSAEERMKNAGSGETKRQGMNAMGLNHPFLGLRRLSRSAGLINERIPRSLCGAAACYGEPKRP